jgi:hypothetical protein
MVDLPVVRRYCFGYTHFSLHSSSERRDVMKGQIKFLKFILSNLCVVYQVRDWFLDVRHACILVAHVFIQVEALRTFDGLRCPFSFRLISTVLNSRLLC